MTKALKILAISSSGGHFVQLLRLMPAFEGTELHVASTDPGLAGEVGAQADRLGHPMPAFHLILDANRWQKVKLVKSLIGIAGLVLRLRPDVVITTGAAPGFFALRVGSMLGARTVWLDSIANAEEVSLSGQKAGKHADLWLTQWPELATPDGPTYEGSVL